MASERSEIRAMAREFAEAELRSRSAEWDARRELEADVFGKLAEQGFLGMLIPEKHGGLGFDHATYVTVLEELAWGDAAVALAVSAHNGLVATMLARHGSQDQKQRWLPALASGATLGAFALSETQAGSDLAAMSTRARREGAGWRIDGDKRWVTNGARAGLVVLFATTGERGVGAFLVTPEDDGFRVGTREQTLGLRASETVSLELRDVRLDADRLVGDARAGLRYALEVVDVGRIGTAAQAVGIGRAAMEHAAAYALQREQFGQPIARFGAIQEKLAGMVGRLAAARALAMEAAGALDAASDGGPRSGLEGATAKAALAKLSASEAATWVTDEAVQVFGGYGYMRHYPVEKLLRDAKGTEIYEGTNEIMRYVVARELLRDMGDVSI